jgi:hypothetical protein
MRESIYNILNDRLEDFIVELGSEQRSIGDLIEYKIKSILFSLKENPIIKEIKEPKSAKSTEDVTIINNDDHIFYIDSKSHNINSEFSMPNLISIEKLRKLFNSENEDIIYVFISYEKHGQDILIKNIRVKYIWEISFDSLRIGSLGKGQLQISDMKKELLFTDIGKQLWFEQLKIKSTEYHKSRIKQIEKDMKLWE